MFRVREQWVRAFFLPQAKRLKQVSISVAKVIAYKINKDVGMTLCQRCAVKNETTAYIITNKSEHLVAC